MNTQSSAPAAAAPTDLELLLAFYKQIGEEVVVDPEYPWESHGSLSTMVTAKDGLHEIRFIFDRKGKYEDKWIHFGEQE